MGRELKQKPMQVDDDSSSTEQEELGEGLLLESSENPWMDHVSYVTVDIFNVWNCLYWLITCRRCKNLGFWIYRTLFPVSLFIF